MDNNNFVYVVTEYDPSMGKEFSLYAYDTYTEAEQMVDLKNSDETTRHYFVKSLRYFRREV